MSFNAIETGVSYSLGTKSSESQITFAYATPFFDNWEGVQSLTGSTLDNKTDSIS